MQLTSNLSCVQYQQNYINKGSSSLVYKIWCTINGASLLHTPATRPQQRTIDRSAELPQRANSWGELADSSDEGEGKGKISRAGTGGVEGDDEHGTYLMEQNAWLLEQLEAKDGQLMLSLLLMGVLMLVLVLVCFL